MDGPKEISDQKTRCGFAVILGAPNAGKSTLVNQLVGQKVSIVTHKVQTTRMLVRGVVMKDEAQVVLVDTPGLFKPRKDLEKAMVKAAWSGVHDADLCIMMVDAARYKVGQLDTILSQLGQVNRPKALVLNKVDMCDKPKLLEISNHLNEVVNFETTFMISALKGSGTGELIDWIAGKMPEGPWLFDPDQLSDLPMRTLAADITREKLLLRVHKEIPYAITVETDSYIQEAKAIRIEQTIYVEKASHKQIILGRKGGSIKAIGQLARLELEEILETRVHLFLFVKVVKGWTRDPHRYLPLGLELPK